MTLSLTDVSPNDAPDVDALMTRVIARELADAAVRAGTLENVRSNLAWSMAHPERCCHLKCVAEEGIVGVILVKQFWNLCSLFVAPELQRRGIGRELVRSCARHFVRHGQFGFYLWVLKANRARLFYEALGGQEIGEKTERLGLHSFSEIAYGWHDLAGLMAPSDKMAV